MLRATQLNLARQYTVMSTGVRLKPKSWFRGMRWTSSGRSLAHVGSRYPPPEGCFSDVPPEECHTT